jgi:hypothetical protein
MNPMFFSVPEVSQDKPTSNEEEQYKKKVMVSSRNVFSE